MITLNLGRDATFRPIELKFAGGHHGDILVLTGDLTQAHEYFATRLARQLRLPYGMVQLAEATDYGAYRRSMEHIGMLAIAEGLPLILLLPVEYAERTRNEYDVTATLTFGYQVIDITTDDTIYHGVRF